MTRLLVLLLSALTCAAGVAPNALHIQSSIPYRFSPVAYYSPGSPQNTMNGAGMSNLKNLAPDIPSVAGYNRDLAQSTAASQPLLSRNDNCGNLQLYSQEFDNAVYGSKVDIVVTPDSVAAPDSTLTADTITPSSNSGYIASAGAIIGDCNGKTLTASVWMRVASGTKTVNYGILRAGDVVEVTDSAVLSDTWQRFSVTGVCGSVSTAFGFYMQSTADTIAWYAWGSTITYSSWSTNYIATTSTPAWPGMNGQRVLVFDGTDDYMKTATFPFVQPETVMGVFEQVSWTDGDRLFDGFNFNTMAVFQNSVSPQVFMYAGSALQPWITTVSTGSPHVLSSVFNGASSAIQDGLGTPVTGNPGASSANGITVGADATQLTFGNILTGDLFLFGRVLTASEQTCLVQWLGRRNGVSVW